MTLSHSASSAFASGHPIALCGPDCRDEVYALALNTGFRIASVDASEILKDQIAIPCTPASKLHWLLMIEGAESLKTSDEHEFLDFLFDGSTKLPENIRIAVHFSSTTDFYEALRDEDVPISVFEEQQANTAEDKTIYPQPSALLAA